MFLETTFPAKFYLYQFGNGIEDFVVFPKSNLACRVGHTVKLAEVENNFFDGKVRLNLGRRNKLGATTLDVSFAWPKNNYFDLHSVKQVFFSGPKPIFFYTFDKKQDLVRFFYNPFVEAIELINQEQQPTNDLGADFEWLRVKLQLLFPFVYECGIITPFGFFDYLDYSLISGQESLVYGLSGLVYGAAGKTYGQQANNQELVVTMYSTLNNQQQKALFLEREQGPVVVWKDWFFAPLKNFANIYPNQPIKVLDTVLTNNQDTFFDTNSASFLETTAENKIYSVYLDSNSTNPIFNAVGQNIQLTNIDNNSDLLIEWRSPQSSPTKMFFLSYTQILYDNNSGLPIPLERYRITQTLPDFLYFSALGRQNKIFASQKEKLRLKKNSANQLKINLHVLPTYVL